MLSRRRTRQRHGNEGDLCYSGDPRQLEGDEASDYQGSEVLSESILSRRQAEQWYWIEEDFFWQNSG